MNQEEHKPASEERIELAGRATEHAGDDTPRIYVASLLDYSCGVLHGGWIDAEQDVEAMEAAATAMLASSPVAAREGLAAEEWAIHDYEGGGLERLPIDEYQPLADIARIVALLGEHDEAFIVLARFSGLDDIDFLETVMRDGYRGHWPTFERYAEQHFDDMGGTAYIAAAPAHLRPYLRLDSAGLAEALATDLTILRGSEGVHVFDPNL